MTSLAEGRMRAAVYREKLRLVVEERPLPELGAQDVLLRVSHCGVCGSDLHMVIEGWGRPDSIGGHEFSGRIAALGATALPLLVVQHPLGGEKPEGVSRRAVQAVEQLGSLLGAS